MGMHFQTTGLDREKFKKLIAEPAPRLEYCIYFTPRSGSSWLTDMAARSGWLGSPRECFNPHFCSDMAQALNTQNMEEYVEAIRRRFSHRRAFGFEITLYQMMRVFGSADPFMKHFGDAVPLWLVRKDIVLQAVSLWKMQSTGMTHSVDVSKEDRKKAEADLRYNADEISHWLDHIARLEQITEEHFRRYKIDPIRIHYERMLDIPPGDFRHFLARIFGLRPMPPKHGDPVHKKLGTSLNDEFADKFRRDRPDECARIDAARADLVRKLDWKWFQAESRGIIPSEYDMFRAELRKSQSA